MPQTHVLRSIKRSRVATARNGGEHRTQNSKQASQVLTHVRTKAYCTPKLKTSPSDPSNPLKIILKIRKTRLISVFMHHHGMRLLQQA
jgi:hypothetical protein